MTEEEVPPPPPIEEDYKDKYLRLLAEIDNTRKRMQKEKLEMTRFTIEGVLADLLTPIDQLENALQCAGTLSEELRNWALGFQMILHQFMEVLASHDVMPFESKGKAFDPILHHAIETEETAEVPEGTILQEFVKGYKSKERIIRPASVKVAKALTTEQL